MLKKGAIKVIVIQTYRMGMRLIAKMVMLKQSMIDMILNMNMMTEIQETIEGRNKVAAKD